VASKDQQYSMSVEMESGERWEVTADQRDIARWEIQPFGGPLSQISAKIATFGRFVAWSASARAGHTSLTWADFDNAAVEVTELETPAADDAADPGKRAASDTT
jgi:hypothetical protein